MAQDLHQHEVCSCDRGVPQTERSSDTRADCQADPWLTSVVSRGDRVFNTEKQLAVMP